MPREIILLPKARDDINTAYWWYENQDRGLGDEFLRSLDAAFTRIASSPLLYPLRIDRFRRILIRRFPYAVYYEHDDTAVTVYLVFHCAQDPDTLRERLAP